MRKLKELVIQNMDLLLQSQGKILLKLSKFTNSVDEIGEGFINDDADVIFTVKFKALIHKPVKGEVIDGIVTKVDRVNFFNIPKFNI